jgi:hypothetical protein
MRVITLLFFIQTEFDGLQAERRQSADGIKIVFRQPVRNRGRVFVYKEYILIVHNEFSSHSRALKVHERKTKLSKSVKRDGMDRPLALNLSYPMVMLC